MLVYALNNVRSVTQLKVGEYSEGTNWPIRKASDKIKAIVRYNEPLWPWYSKEVNN